MTIEAGTVALMIGVATLIVERTYHWAVKVKQSDCLGVHIEMAPMHADEDSTPPAKKHASLPNAA